MLTSKLRKGKGNKSRYDCYPAGNHYYNSLYLYRIVETNYYNDAEWSSRKKPKRLHEPFKIDRIGVCGEVVWAREKEEQEEEARRVLDSAHLFYP